MDAINTYLSRQNDVHKIDVLLREERILFCCYSRLLATFWVRSERGRNQSSTKVMPSHLTGSCTTLKEAILIAEQGNPTLVITTQLLEEGSGLDLIRKVKEINNKTKTILFLQHQNLPIYQQAINTHSDCILLENLVGSGHVIEAIKIASKGGMYLEPEIADRISGTYKSKNIEITSREIEIMNLVVNGNNDREIGQLLHLSTDTIKYHLKQIYNKLNLHNRTRAAITLLLMGLVDAPKPLIPESIK